jgi:hypothetical protein
VLIVGTASAPPSSSSPTGGFSWSCVHSPLKLFDILLLQSFADLRGRARQTFWATRAEFRRARTTGSTHLQIAAGYTLERTPTLETNCLFANEKIYFSVSVFRYRIRERRLGTAGAEGLRGNEA